MLSLAASLENLSEHPLAEAIVSHARNQEIKLEKVENFESVTGKGIAGSIKGRKIAVGSDSFAGNGENPNK
ncbi:MAG TPA: hypothetical protein DEA22_05155, partial [Blastocatellia bacterium]|nr:hypothetical protein [Blastocatellia bacterium]